MKVIISVVLFLAFVFVSCEKDEALVRVDDNAVKAQLAAQPSPEKQEFIEVAATKLSLKLATTATSLIEVFPLAEETFEVWEDHADKKFVYYDLKASSERRDVLTMIQRFPIENGKLNTSDYTIEYVAGCEDSQWFTLEINEGTWICDVTCIFHFDNGSQFAYRIAEGNLSECKLPKIGKGKWEIVVVTYDGDLTRRQTTGFIQSLDEHQSLRLKVQAKPSNVVAQLKIKREVLKGVFYITVWGIDEQTAEEIWMNIPFFYSKELQSNVLFDLPFHPEYVSLLFENEERQYNLNRTEEGGKTIYTLENY